MTKQLKFAVVLLVTIASVNLNAQKKSPAKSAKPATEKASAKPTKQETMDWIAEKMKEKLAGNRVFISYSNGEFVYRKQVGVYSCNTTIYLNRITGSSPEYSDDFFIKGSVISFSDCGKEYEFRNSSSNNISIGGPNYNDYADPFEFKNDNSLVERLKKAFATLIEYNSSQKGANEKF
ncbi:hypothetical protein [Chryseobacterium luquanense]|uniref:DUF4468 domain-containing protein n=1 Tax=Chryseobacterium luquanense TaxID=2983766 RepID=A0ABT3Y942_9FLAO|nr:hypothetical protein [Chryseobacterium luquanense]MCX8534603.1 hypothetical protein [Chryseobacterium luquanense]